jgi:hypothetical protein
MNSPPSPVIDLAEGGVNTLFTPAFADLALVPPDTKTKVFFPYLGG